MKSMKGWINILLLPSLVGGMGCGGKEPTGSKTSHPINPVNLDDYDPGDHVKGSKESPLTIAWSSGDKDTQRVLQIYFEGQLVYDEVQSPGIEVRFEQCGLHEIKIWVLGSSVSEKNVWVDIVTEDCPRISEKGTQFDNNWITTPGDGSLPERSDYQTAYARYVQVDNINPSYSTLVADAEALKSDSEGTSSEPHIVHNITYLPKQDPRASKGRHTASYYFQIPSFTKGTTTEGGLFVWVSDEKVRRDFGTAFQLIVAEADTNFGKIYYWGGSAKKWVYSDRRIEPATDFFYKVTFIVSVEDRDATIIFEDKNESYTFGSNVFSETEKGENENWPSYTVARLQAECISKDGMRHTVNFKDYSWNHL